MSIADELPIPSKKKVHPLRRALLRGLAILLPPLLTIVLFIYAFGLIEQYVLVPTEGAACWAAVYATADTIDEVPFSNPDSDRRVSHDDQGQIVSFNYGNRTYTRSDDRWKGYYSPDYVRANYLQRWKTLPVFLIVFIGVLYLLGTFVAAGIGKYVVHTTERLIGRLPLISYVYSSVKQVTDYVFTEKEIEFNRVVAVEYPRKGIWSLGFVTGESLLDIRSAANQPVLSIFIPNSPAPLTGFTITVLKTEAIDLNITIDQAIKFIVSGGVVVPPQQLPVGARLPAALAAHDRTNGDGSNMAGASSSISQNALATRESTNGDGGNGAGHERRKGDVESSE